MPFLIVKYIRKLLLFFSNFIIDVEAEVNHVITYRKTLLKRKQDVFGFESCLVSRFRFFVDNVIVARMERFTG